MSCYDLNYIKVKDEVVGARPTHWSAPDEDGFGHDIEGNEIHAIVWMATCPYCANLMEINKTEICTIDGVSFAGCKTCGVGEVEAPDAVDESDAMDPEQLVEELFSNSPTVEFLDPIDDGSFDIEVDRDRTPGLV